MVGSRKSAKNLFEEGGSGVRHVLTQHKVWTPASLSGIVRPLALPGANAFSGREGEGDRVGALASGRVPWLREAHRHERDTGASAHACALPREARSGKPHGRREAVFVAAFMTALLALGQEAAAGGPYDGDYEGELTHTCTGDVPGGAGTSRNVFGFSVRDSRILGFDVTIDPSGRATSGLSGGGQTATFGWVFTGDSVRYTSTFRTTLPPISCTDSAVLKRKGALGGLGPGVVNPIGDFATLLFWGSALLGAVSVLGLGVMKALGALRGVAAPAAPAGTAAPPQRLTGIRPDVAWGNPPTPPPLGATDAASRPLPRWRTHAGAAAPVAPIQPHTPQGPQYAPPSAPPSFQGAAPSVIGPGGEPIEGPGITTPLPRFAGARNCSISRVGDAVRLDWERPLHDPAAGELLGYEIYRYEPAPASTGWQLTPVDFVPEDATSDTVAHKELSRYYGVRPIYRTPDGFVFGAGSQP